MGAGYHGGFGNTKGAKSYKNKSLHKDRQGKHIVGDKNYTPGRSIFSGSLSDAQSLIKHYSGTGVKLSGNKERVDFGRIIGYYVDQSTGIKSPTTTGIIHYSKDGVYIVPVNQRMIKMLSEKEKSIVEEFYNSLSKLTNKKLKLIWESGFIIGVFDTCFDDFSEHDETDEYTSFVFKVISVDGDVPVEISEDNYCVINYHNFPLRIEM